MFKLRVQNSPFFFFHKHIFQNTFGRIVLIYKSIAEVGDIQNRFVQFLNILRIKNITKAYCKMIDFTYHFFFKLQLNDGANEFTVVERLLSYKIFSIRNNVDKTKSLNQFLKILLCSTLDKVALNIIILVREIYNAFLYYNKNT